MHFIRDGRPLSDEEIAAVISRCTGLGIFALCDMGHISGNGLRAKRVAAGMPQIHTAGRAIMKHGYGSFLARAVESTADIIRAVNELADEGADFIKVINSGIVDITAGGVTRGGFPLQDLALICREAAARGLAVACHANGDDAIRAAVEAGVTSIEHGFFISRDTIQKMAEQGVAWTPTAYALSRLGATLAADAKQTLDGIIADHLASIAYAAEAGVQLRVGTDSGSPGVVPGDSFFEELRLFRQAGLTLRQIVAAACMGEDAFDGKVHLIVAEDFVETGRVAVHHEPR